MKSKLLVIFACVMLACGLIFGIIGVTRYTAEQNAGKVYDELKTDLEIAPLTTAPPLQEEQPVNPIDFEALTAEYPDAYAWIRIPGTKVDYPIVQHPDDNAYYLTHAIDGQKKREGAIYTENYNSKTFDDPNTIIYGHDMRNGSMFKTLHKYKDKQFLLENSDLYIYQENRVLQYKIFAAYISDDKHLMLTYDFTDENIFRDYLKNVLTKTNMSSNIYTDVDVNVDDKIITLSTCNGNNAQRYLVQAVLVSTVEYGKDE